MKYNPDYSLKTLLVFSTVICLSFFFCDIFLKESHGAPQNVAAVTNALIFLYSPISEADFKFKDDL